MEISLANLFLIVWAVVATVLGYIEHQQKKQLVFILTEFLSDEKTREEAVAKWKRVHS